MFLRFTVFFVVCIFTITAALPSEGHRVRRDFVDSVKNAWGEVAKTFNNAGDAIVNVFKPTESTVDKIAGSIKNLGQ